MRVEMVRGTCDDKAICPTLWRTDRSSVAVQGWNTDRPGEVEVPAELLDGMDGLAGETTDRGTVLVRGVPVTDVEALAMMEIPDGESAVEVPVVI